MALNNRHFDMKSMRRKSRTTTDLDCFRKEDNLISSFLLNVFLDLSKRSLKPIDIFTITELTELPLLICEKLIKIVSPVTLFFTEENFIAYMQKLFFSTEKLRIQFFTELADFRQKNLIYKHDIKVLFLHLHMHILPYKFKNDLIEIINDFFKETNKLTISDFLDYSYKANFDVCYIYLIFMDKYSFINYESLELFNKEICKGKINLDKFKKRNYNLSHVSQKALDYARKIQLFKNRDKDPFNDDIDEDLDELENFENEISKVICGNYTNHINESLIGTKKNQIVEIANISTTDTLFETKKIKDNFDQEYNNNIFHSYISEVSKKSDKSDMSNISNIKVLGLFSNKKLYNFGLLPPKFKRSLSFKRNKSCDLNSLKNFEKEHIVDWHNNYTTLICFKQSKKVKDFKIVKLLLVGNFIFYFSSENNNNINSNVNSSKNNNIKISKNLRIGDENAHRKELNKQKSSITRRNSKTKFLSFNNDSGCNFSNHIKEYGNKKLKNTKSCDKFENKETTFKLKKIIFAKRLYSTIVKFNDSTYFQLQLHSNIHNSHRVYIFYSKKEHDFISFTRKLNKLQHQKGVNFGDNYDVISKIGKGKFGNVVLAMHKLSKKTVAVKIISKIDLSLEENFKAIKWENDIFKFLENASCACNNIIRCYEFYETPDNIYYVNEYISDGTLKNYLDNYTNISLKLQQKTINEICIQLLNGISFLHKCGIIHRDIKLTNTLIKKSKKKLFNFETDKGLKVSIHDIEEIKIIDFGLCKAMGFEDTTKEPYGSLSYKAPELILENYYTFSVDIWSYGITIYYLMFQEFPVSADNINVLKEKIISENYLESIVKKGSYQDLGWRVIFETLVKDSKKRPKANELLKHITNK